MAYLRELRKECWCGKQAVVEVFNLRNSSHGTYCRRHGEELVKKLDATERGRVTKSAAEG